MRAGAFTCIRVFLSLLEDRFRTAAALPLRMDMGNAIEAAQTVLAGGLFRDT